MFKWGMVVTAAVLAMSLFFHSCADSSSNDSRPVIKLTGNAV